MSAMLTRRQLFSRIRGGPRQVRPPWARADALFTDRCTQCGICAEACPQNIITSGHAGYPIIDFSANGCTFCGTCADVCDENCFLPEGERAGSPWENVAVVDDGCVEMKGVVCRLCEEACEYEALRFRPQLGGRSQLLVDAKSCTGCGSCVGHCPVGALTVGETEAEETAS